MIWLTFMVHFPLLFLYSCDHVPQATTVIQVASIVQTVNHIPLVMRPVALSPSPAGVTPADAVPEWYWDAHQGINPEDPYAVYEFQGGAFDGWYTPFLDSALCLIFLARGGSGFEKCSQLLGTEFQRGSVPFSLIF